MRKISIITFLAILFLLVNICKTQDNIRTVKRQYQGSYDQMIQYNQAGTGVGYSRNGFGGAYGFGSLTGYSYGRRRRSLKNLVMKR